MQGDPPPAEPCLPRWAATEEAPWPGPQRSSRRSSTATSRCSPSAIRWSTSTSPSLGLASGSTPGWAAAYDLKAFFCVIAKEPAEVGTVDIVSIIAEQRRPRRGHGVVRLEDREAGLAARTIKRRLASLSGFGDAFTCAHRTFYDEFIAGARAIGFLGDRPRRQWSALAQAAAVHGVAPAALTTAQIVEARGLLREALFETGRAGQAERISAALFECQVTLFHLGVLQEGPRRRGRNVGQRQRAEWKAVAAGVAETMQRYLTQLELTRRPATVRQVEGTLREFALFLAREAPEVSSVATMRRRDVLRPQSPPSPARPRRSGSRCCDSSSIASPRGMGRRAHLASDHLQ